MTANFAINTYTLTYAAGANGSITGVCRQTVNYGADGRRSSRRFPTRTTTSSTGPTPARSTRGRDTNVQANLSVTANFTINTYTLTYTAGANGTITGVSPQTVNHGASGTAVTAVPDTGYHFVSWSDGVLTAARTDTNVTSDISVTANFAITTYTLTYTAGANGSITGASPQTIDHGSDGTAVTAVPNAGYHFVNWSDASPANPRTNTNVQANLSVTANFAINTLHADLYGRCERLDLRSFAPDGELRGGWQPRHGGSRRELSLRQLVRRQHREPSDGLERYGRPLGDGQLRDRHLYPDLHGRRQRHDHGHVASNGELRRLGHGGHGSPE